MRKRKREEEGKEGELEPKGRGEEAGTRKGTRDERCCLVESFDVQRLSRYLS